MGRVSCGEGGTGGATPGNGGPVFPANPQHGDEYEFRYPDGQKVFYKYNSDTSTWDWVFFLLPEATVQSYPTTYPHLVTDGPMDGQNILGPDNVLYVFDGTTGNWTGAPKTSGLRYGELILICPQTFKFHTVGANWQAAGVVGYRFTIVDLGGPGNSVRMNTITFSFEVGMPLYSNVAGTISTEFAKEISKNAVNLAEHYVANHYGSDFFGPGAQSTYGHLMTQKMQEFLNNQLGGTNIATVNFGLNVISNAQAQRPKYWDSPLGGCN